MYGLIVKLTAASGRRNDLIDMMGGEDSQTVPGCLSYIVAEDVADENILWITEVWASKADHEASLQAPPIKKNLVSADTLIAGFEKIATTQPVRKSSHPMHGDVI